MVDPTLKRAILDLYDNRSRLTKYDLDEWESLLSNTAYFLRQEQEKRLAKYVDECLEGAPV